MELDEYISTIKELLTDHLTTGHALLSSYATDDFEPIVARSMLVAASFNISNNEKAEDLISCAVSLELLRAGIENHYNTGEETAVDTSDACRVRNLNIISADYYYAKSIAIAARLNRDDIISCLVGAIADISEAEIIYRTTADINELDEYFYEKNAGIFRAAIRMGELIAGEVDSEIGLVLHRYAILSSLMCTNPNAKDTALDTESLKQSVLKELDILPKSQQQELANMINRLQ
jgi:hypothetical protein